ncbi:hypothetical protein D3C71_2012030 [compost metagenome]
MHDTLRDALAVLVGQLLDQLVVLHQQRATRAGAQGILVVRNRVASTGGEGWLLAHA